MPEAMAEQIAIAAAGLMLEIILGMK